MGWLGIEERSRGGAGENPRETVDAENNFSKAPCRAPFFHLAAPFFCLVSTDSWEFAKASTMRSRIEISRSLLCLFSFARNLSLGLGREATFNSNLVFPNFRLVSNSSSAPLFWFLFSYQSSTALLNGWILLHWQIGYQANLASCPRWYAKVCFPDRLFLYVIKAIFL